jgi:hypothetical protein
MREHIGRTLEVCSDAPCGLVDGCLDRWVQVSLAVSRVPCYSSLADNKGVCKRDSTG